jgi:hypothetical protein
MVPSLVMKAAALQIVIQIQNDWQKEMESEQSARATGGIVQWIFALLQIQ